MKLTRLILLKKTQWYKLLLRFSWQYTFFPIFFLKKPCLIFRKPYFFFKKRSIFISHHNKGQYVLQTILMSKYEILFCHIPLHSNENFNVNKIFECIIGKNYSNKSFLTNSLMIYLADLSNDVYLICIT